MIFNLREVYYSKSDYTFISSLFKIVYLVFKFYQLTIKKYSISCYLI